MVTTNIAGRVVEVVKGRLLENQVIVISDERISQVGPASDIRVPAEANQLFIRCRGASRSY